MEKILKNNIKLVQVRKRIILKVQRENNLMM